MTTFGHEGYRNTPNGVWRQRRFTTSISPARFKSEVDGLAAAGVEGREVVANATRVVVQDGRRLLREGIAMSLEFDPDITVVATASSGADLIDVCTSETVDVVVMEADARECDVPLLIHALRAAHPGVAIVGLYGILHVSQLAKAMRAGVSTLVDRSDGIDAVISAVRHPNRAVTPLPRARHDSDNDASLTARECEVLELIGTGSTSLETSQSLGISVKTVENHKQRIFGKLGVQNQAHAVAVAMGRGLLATDVGLPRRTVL